MSVRSRIALAIGVAGLAAACGRSPAAPAPNPAVTIRPIHVDSVEVILQGPPSAHVQGVVGDGCTQVSGTEIARQAAEITITILAQRPTDAICTQIARLYDETLRLPGEYPSGTYTLRVNGVERSFTIP